MSRSRNHLLALIAVSAIGCGFSPGQGQGTGNGNPGTGNGTGVLGTGGSGLSTGGSGNTGAGGSMSNCGETTTMASKLPPDILIVQDRSGSMDNNSNDGSCNGGCGAASKWAQTTSAINQVVGQTDTAVNWGLKFFADSDNVCGVSQNVAVPVATGNAGMIMSQFAMSTKANGGLTNGSRTPTRLAVNAAAAYLGTLTDSNPKYLLLATDGLPNCMPGNNDNTADDSQGAITAVGNALSAGFPTFVIGIGNTMGTTTLNGMATAGGVPQQGAATQFYQVSDSATLATALTQIVGIVATCTFSVPNPPGQNTSRSNIRVTGDSNTVPKDTSHANGWDYTDASMTSVTLYGSYCDQVKGGQIQAVSIIFQCVIG